MKEPPGKNPENPVWPLTDSLIQKNEGKISLDGVVNRFTMRLVGAVHPRF